MRPTSLVLLSAGLDSSLALVQAAKDTHILYAVTFDYGQLSRKQEIESAKRICQKFEIAHQVIKLPFFAEMTGHPLFDEQAQMPTPQAADLDDREKAGKTAAAVWVPNRNGVFLNVAASLAEAQRADRIYVGFNAEEAATFPDNSQAFLDEVNRALAYSTLRKVQVVAPTIGMNKVQILKELHASGFDLNHVWSCYLGHKTMCGACESCQRLKRAFRANELDASQLFTSLS